MPRRLYSKLRRQYEPDTIRPREQVEKLTTAIKKVGSDTRDNGTLQDFFTNFMGNKLVGESIATNTVHFDRHPAREHKDTVVVIGAGLAGLSCAYELLKSRHFEVVIIEAKNRVGGRVWTVHQDDFEVPIDSSKHSYPTVERGGELIGLNHFFWLNYADEFGLHLDWLEPEEVEKKNEDDEPIDERFMRYKYMKLIMDEMDWEARKIQRKLYEADGADLRRPKPWGIPAAKADYDDKSLASYLDGLTSKFFALCAEELKKRNFDVDRLGAFDREMFEQAIAATKADFENNNGTPCETQSLYFNLITIANGNRKIAAEMIKNIEDNLELQNKKVRRLSFWDDSELFRCREGNGALAMEFRDHIKRLGGKIILDTEVSSVDISGDSVKINIKKTGSNEIVPFETEGSKIVKVVSAVAPSVWHNINFGNINMPAAPQMGYLVKYLFNVRGDVTEEFRTLAKSNHTQWGMVWEAALNDVPADDAGKSTVLNTLALFAGGSHALAISKLPTPEARREYIFNNLNLMRPVDATKEFSTKSILGDVFMDWPKDPHVEGGYACPAVGEVFNLGPAIHSGIDDKLYFAGEFACRYKWVGFMEGALISGAGVAKEILKPFKQFI